MNKTQEKLQEETKKWLNKLEQETKNIDKEVDQVENILAYEKDTKHILEEEDYIRAWESVIYAWGILETLQRLDKL